MKTEWIVVAATHLTLAVDVGVMNFTLWPLDPTVRPLPVCQTTCVPEPV
jgi:hypothetical protein